MIRFYVLVVTIYRVFGPRKKVDQFVNDLCIPCTLVPMVPVLEPISGTRYLAPGTCYPSYESETLELPVFQCWGATLHAYKGTEPTGICAEVQSRTTCPT